MSIKKTEIDDFIRHCDNLSDELALNGTFKDLESGGKEYCYNSLVFCLIDAVFSIGVRYKSVENTVSNYANYYHLNQFDDSKRDEYTIEDFLNNYYNFNENVCSNNPSVAKCVFNNQQRTSSKSGILKAQACCEVAEKLKSYNVNTLQDFNNLSNDQKDQLENQVKLVPGQKSGIMFSYLCMLAGDENTCKPDRWIKSFLKSIKLDRISLNDKDIQELFKTACEEMKSNYPDITVRYLDYQIWSFQRRKEKQSKKNK